MDIKRNTNGNILYTKEMIDFVVKEYNENKKSFNTIAREQGESYSTISNIYHKSGLPVRTDREQAKRYTVNENYFTVIDTEEKAYWLGFLYADGYITQKRKYNGYRVGCSLSVKDIKHLYKLKECLEYTGNIKEYTVINGYKQGTKYCRLLIASDKMAEDLIKLGCGIQKTNNLKFPSIEQVPKDFQFPFIRGLIDGDGSVIISHNSDGYIEYEISFTGTKNMCNSITNILVGKQFALQKRHKDRNNDNFSFVISGCNQVKKVLTDLYLNANIYLDRKYEKAIQILNDGR